MDILRRLFVQPDDSSDEAKKDDSQATDAQPVQTSQPPPPAPVTTRPLALADTEPLEPLTTAKTEQNIIIVESSTRPLTSDMVTPRASTHLSYGQATDIGMVRSNNQDSSFCFMSTNRSADNLPDVGLFIVADGMGGHHDGEKASALAARSVGDYLVKHVYVPMISPKPDEELVPIAEALEQAVLEANAKLLVSVPDGGTTITAALIIGDLAYFAHVGDSRAYFIHKNAYEQITRDHSLVQRLIELGQLTHAEAQVHSQKNMLYRALGQSDELEVDTISRRLSPGSSLLLCSDGLWNLVNEHEMVEIIASHDNPQEACDKLVTLANLHGGSDNITAVLLRLPVR